MVLAVSSHARKVDNPSLGRQRTQHPMSGSPATRSSVTGVILAGGRAQDFASAMTLARSSVDSGKALQSLDQMIEISNRG